MVSLPRWLRLPRPKTFLYLMSLRTGTELVTLTMLFNKLSGLYGLLAILTGFHLNATQLSMYIYSLIGLVITASLMPHIRKQSPFECLALAWLYILDTLVNAVYTTVFAVTWFLTVSATHSENSDLPIKAPGGSTIDDTAGFTSPKYNVSQVDIIAFPSDGMAKRQDAVAFATIGTAAVSAASPSVGHGLQLAESLPSIIAIIVFTLIRIYFIFVVMAYARQVLNQYMFAISSAHTHSHLHLDSGAEEPADPFSIDSPQGQGWKGNLGRAMVRFGRGYWLDVQMEMDAEWASGLNGKFSSTKVAGAPAGTMERERRARSGTGPPAPLLK